MIRKLLIANRGEIAVRVIRAARELGIRTVAVTSEADVGLPFVALADEAHILGAPEPQHSYLDVEKILTIATQTQADAIHPGYGFLSERAEFAEACQAAGITFVGPSPAAMRALGGKIDAKTLAVAAGVPVTPGYFEPEATLDDLRVAAHRIGFPVMLKASAGGGGRGMRVVRHPEDFDHEFHMATDEALRAFGDGAMLVEKLIDRPRHVEVQVLADHHGQAVALFERECSVQRRHQKLLEEAPYPHADAPFLEPMREAALALVKQAGYTNAGTCEFIVDPESGEFYFLEVNARLQVEHPVTEAVTGVDLVQWQLRIASGEPLPASILNLGRQNLRGHAIEARIVAEDPAQGFLPSIGPILAWSEPRMPGVRVDTGYGPGTEVSRFYDSLLAKVIATGTTRTEALARLKAALLDFHILGPKTNLDFLLAVLDEPGFQAGEADTGYVQRVFGGWVPSPDVPPELRDLLEWATPTALASSKEAPRGAWDLQDSWRNVKA